MHTQASPVEPDVAGEARKDLLAIARDRIDAFVGTIKEDGSYKSPIYKSARSVSRQIAVDYSSRFLIELIQNAYDAHPPSETGGRIAISLDPSEGEFGTLYVANDGRPFGRRNVESLCDIGLSDKELGQSIGNKGLGFRSVSYVCDDPRIYSGNEPNESAEYEYTGYCFRFARADDYAELIEDSRHRALAAADLPLFHVPIPLVEQGAHVRALATAGFVTVIQLPLRSASALDDTKVEITRLRETEAPVLLFLRRLKQLSVTVHGDPNSSFVLTREASSINLALDSPSRVERDVVDLGSSGCFLVGHDRVPEEVVLDAIRCSIDENHLDDSWLDWTGDGEVAIAVRLDGDVTAPGLYTYLPMEVDARAPFAGYLHGAFFTKLDRRHLDPAIPLNRLYFSRAPQLAAQLLVALNLSREEPPHPLFEGALRRVLPDLLSWVAVKDRTGRELVKAPVEIVSAAERLGYDLLALPILPIVSGGGTGWGSIEETWAWTDERGGWFSSARLASLAQIPLLDPDLGQDRRKRIEQFVQDIGSRLEPNLEEVAAWIERTARVLAGRGSPEEWQSFYGSLPGLFRRSPRQLFGRKILLCADHKLRAAVLPDDDGATGAPTGRRGRSGARTLTIFLPPKKGDEDVVRLPSALTSGLAFADDRLNWYSEEMRGAGSFLQEAGLVRAYNAPELISHVARMLERTTSKRRFSEALQWVFRLYRQARQRKRSVSVVGERLFVPTRGDEWVLASDAYFSSGWPEDTAGDLLSEFLRGAADTSEHLQRINSHLVASPADSLFSNGAVEEWTEFLSELGVRRGIEPVRLTKPRGILRGRSIRADSLGQRLQLRASVVQDWANDIEEKGGEASYRSSDHEVDGELWFLPGQDVHQSWPTETRESFAELILGWSPAATSEHVGLAFFSHAARHASRFRWPTPLAAFLRQGKWFPVRAPTSATEQVEFARPRDVWVADNERGEHPPSFVPSPPRALRRLLDRRPQVLAALHRTCEVRLWNEPASLARQADMLARLFAQEQVSTHEIPALLNVYRATWNRLTEEVSELGWTGDEYLIVQRADAFESIPVRTNASHAGASAQETVYVGDSSQELAIHLLQTLGECVFNFASTNPQSGWQLLKPVLSERGRSASSVAIEIRVDGQALVTTNSLGHRLEDICPAIGFLVLIAAESLSGPAMQALPVDRRELLTRLARMTVVPAQRIEFVIEGRRALLPENLYGALSLNHEGRAWVLIESPNVPLEWGDFVRASHAVAELLRQLALEHPLKIAFRTLERSGEQLGASSVSPAIQLEIAAELGVDPRAVEHVRAILQGELAWLHRLLRPVAFYFDGSEAVRQLDREMNRIKSGDELFAELPALAPSISQEQLSACKEVTSLADVRDVLGLEYERFNEALEAVGEEPEEHPELHAAVLQEFISRNREWIYEALRCPFLQLFERQQGLDSYLALRAELESLVPPPEWLRRFRSPPEDVLRSFITDWLQKHGLSAIAPEGAKLPSIEDTRRTNKRTLDRFVDRADRVIRAWCGANSRSVPSDWHNPVTSKRLLSNSLYEAGAFDFLPLTDLNLAAWLVSLGQWPEDMPPSLDLGELGLTPEQLDAAQRARQEEKERAERQKRSLDFGGDTLDPASLDAGALLERVSQLVSEKDGLPQFGETVTLPITSGGKISGGPGGKGTRRRERLHPDKADLVGLIGECIVYRWLRQQFPDKDIDAAWVSTMRSRILPGEGDDGLGYDFSLSFRNREWRIEVKAHIGDPREIELGETEVAAANECARWRTKEYTIIYISHVDDPARMRLEQLPNPFRREHQREYRLVGEGLRYRFSRPNSS